MRLGFVSAAVSVYTKCLILWDRHGLHLPLALEILSAYGSANRGSKPGWYMSVSVTTAVMFQAKDVLQLVDQIHGRFPRPCRHWVVVNGCVHNPHMDGHSCKWEGHQMHRGHLGVGDGLCQYSRAGQLLSSWNTSCSAIVDSWMLPRQW